MIYIELDNIKHIVNLSTASDNCGISINLYALNIYCNHIHIIRLCIEKVSFRKITDTVVDMFENIYFIIVIGRYESIFFL